jgi:hypothetical protein
VPNCSPHPRRLRAAVSRLAASVDREQRPTYYFDMDDFPVLVSALSKERRIRHRQPKCRDGLLPAYAASPQAPSV